MKALPKKILFSLVLTVALAELALRVYVHHYPSVLAYNPNRYGMLKARPGDLSYGFPINDEGFKDRPFRAEKAPGEYRVAAVGDSFVFGMVPYEAGFCTVLEERFPGVNVMNFGVIGTKPEDYAAILRKDALPHAPDAVVVFIYVGNDFLFSRRKWVDHSVLATVVHHSIKALKAHHGQDIRQNYVYRDNMTPFSYREFLATVTRYAETYHMDADLFEWVFDRTMLSIRGMQDICLQNRIRFHVVLLPDRLQLDAALQSEVAGQRQRPMAAFDFFRPQRMLAAALESGGISFVDLYESFAHDDQKKFINHDIHYNVHGNRLVAEGLPEAWFVPAH